MIKHDILIMEQEKNPAHQTDTCQMHMQAIHETLRMLNGKWKIAILGSLGFGCKRFTDLQRDVKGIGPKMLSKELHDLEQNGLITRTVKSTRPVSVSYEVSAYGKTLGSIIKEMALWGSRHKKMLQKQQ